MMHTDMMNAAPALEDRVGGELQIEAYVGTTSTFDLLDYEMKHVLDDVLLVQFIDCDESGGAIKRGGIYLPMNAMQINQAWRLARVLLAGPKCQTVKVGDVICVPGDKGMKINNVPVAGHGDVSNACFLNEARVFGVVQNRNKA